MHHRLLALVGFAAVALSMPAAAPLHAQEEVEGVRIGLTYDPTAKPGIVVLPVAGAGGDSIRAMLQRDFDYRHRNNEIGGQGSDLSISPGADGRPNYPLYARLGATGIVQAAVTAAGGLTVQVHDVNKQNVARTRSFQLPSASQAAEWRLAVHAVADEIESW